MSINQHEQSWLTIRQFAIDQIEGARSALEGHGMSMEATEHHRGKVAAYRAILALGESKAPEVMSKPFDYDRIM